MLARYILLGVMVLLASFGGAYVTNLVFENRMKPNYSLVPNEPAGDLMNDMTAEMETPDRNFVTVDETELPDAAEVIGVEVNGQSYAFPKKYMSGVGDHIASEVFGGLPVAVTYCNESECVRVFSNRQSSSRIELEQFGLINEGLAVKFQGKVYAQESNDIPLEDYDFTVVSWLEWKAANPSGLVLTELIWDDEQDSTERVD